MIFLEYINIGNCSILLFFPKVQKAVSFQILQLVEKNHRIIALASLRPSTPA